MNDSNENQIVKPDINVWLMNGWELWQQLRKLRIAANLSQRELAESIGTSQWKISTLEMKRKMYSYDERRYWGERALRYFGFQVPTHKANRIITRKNGTVVVPNPAIPAMKNGKTPFLPHPVGLATQPASVSDEVAACFRTLLSHVPNIEAAEQIVRVWDTWQT